MEKFLKKMLLEEAGIYTLLGDKPLSDILIYTGSSEEISLEGLSAESLQNIVFVDDQVLENWQAWKRFIKNKHFKNICFAERKSPYDPLHTVYMIINIEKLKQVIDDNLSVFCLKAKTETLDTNQLIEEIGDEHSIFWNLVFRDNYLSGLIHGYGSENSRYFTTIHDANEKLCFSERFTGPVTSQNFPLPLYVVAKKESMTAHYAKQRESIKKIYDKKDFFAETLKHLKS